jgi:hypothetical protein
MSEDRASLSGEAPVAPNGPGAAAVLAAGVGCFLVGALAVAADGSALLKKLLNFYAPTGPLSGVTTVAVLGWLMAWPLLHVRWKRRDVALERVNAIAFALLCLGLLLTFPPIAEML